MKDHLYELSALCVKKLAEQGRQVALAESCTGGLIAKSLTDHSGSSAVFECGIVSYSGSVKNKLIGVKENTLNKYGEVSEQTAKEMACGIKELAKADYGVGVTGIAGPTGATKDKKVGLIYVAISDAEGTQVYKLELYDDISRTQRRGVTAEFVFKKLLERL